jgi:hypothetical protein
MILDHPVNLTRLVCSLPSGSRHIIDVWQAACWPKGSLSVVYRFWRAAKSAFPSWRAQTKAATSRGIATHILLVRKPPATTKKATQSSPQTTARFMHFTSFRCSFLYLVAAHVRLRRVRARRLPRRSRLSQSRAFALFASYHHLLPVCCGVLLCAVTRGDP